MTGLADQSIRQSRSETDWSECAVYPSVIQTDWADWTAWTEWAEWAEWDEWPEWADCLTD